MRVFATCDSCAALSMGVRHARYPLTPSTTPRRRLVTVQALGYKRLCCPSPQAVEQLAFADKILLNKVRGWADP